jgi:hypothetical protein
VGDAETISISFALVWERQDFKWDLRQVIRSETMVFGGQWRGRLETDSGPSWLCV